MNHLEKIILPEGPKRKFDTASHVSTLAKVHLASNLTINMSDAYFLIVS